MNRITGWIIFTFVVAGSLVGSAIYGAHKLHTAVRLEYLSKQSDMLIAFEERIKQAEHETEDPCIGGFYRIVHPPAELNGAEATVIMMGRVVSDVEPSSLHLVVRKDGSLELYVGNSQVGRRFSAESQACRTH